MEKFHKSSLPYQSPGLYSYGKVPTCTKSFDSNILHQIPLNREVGNIYSQQNTNLQKNTTKFKI